jgi:hypothetical protein
VAALQKAARLLLLYTDRAPWPLGKGVHSYLSDLRKSLEEKEPDKYAEGWNDGWNACMIERGELVVGTPASSPIAEPAPYRSPPECLRCGALSTSHPIRMPDGSTCDGGPWKLGGSNE